MFHLFYIYPLYAVISYHLLMLLMRVYVFTAVSFKSCCVIREARSQSNQARTSSPRSSADEETNTQVIPVPLSPTVAW